MRKPQNILLTLGIIAVLIPLYFMTKDEKVNAVEIPNLQMFVMSDVHVNKDKPDNKFENALKDSLSIVPHPDVLSVVGDMTDYGLEQEYDIFNDIINRNMPIDTQKLLVMGNHEYYEPRYDKSSTITDKQMQQRFIEKVNVPNLYYDKWINGYHFITLGGELGYFSLQKMYPNEPYAVMNAYISDQQYLWFEKTIAKKVENHKPIFVFLHQPIANIINGNVWDFKYSKKRLYKIMKKYPQVIFFSGHSHYLLENKDSIIQNGITMVNTGSVKYGLVKGTGNIPSSEGYIVNVYSNKVEIKARDYQNRKWIKKVNIPLY